MLIQGEKLEHEHDNYDIYYKNHIKIKSKLESQKSYYTTKKMFFFSSPEVAELIRQYHIQT